MKYYIRATFNKDTGKKEESAEEIRLQEHGEPQIRP